MIRKIFVVLICLIVFLSCSTIRQGTINQKANKRIFNSSIDSVSYAYGLYFGSTIAQFGIEDKIVLEKVLQGIKDMIGGNDTFLFNSRRESIKYMENFISMQAQIVRKEKEDEQKKREQLFLEKNSKKKGVVLLSNGLQYKIIEEGNGIKPKLKSNIICNYKGYLIDGTVFDDTSKKGEPSTFKLNNLVKGWQEGLQLMSEGSKFILYIPSDLAYGSKKTGKINPFSTLIFEIHLVKVE
ncbi:FKBP-type peptidyl-prolyl cis-trans isomerase [Labilibaculum euxinus]